MIRPHYDGDRVWVTPPRLAVEFNKTEMTMRRWCYSGFILSLGYLLRREPRGRWLIGIPLDEYRTFRTASLYLSPPPVFPLAREHTASTEPGTVRS